jgi:nitrate reductase gamma subunit
MIKTFLFAAFPYIAIVLAVLGGLYRYFSHRFTYSSISSQLLENRWLFWGSVPWHYGIILILLAHLGTGLFPFFAASVLGNPVTLVVFELIGMALALFTIFGLIVLIVRRLPLDSLARSVTSKMDWILLLFLLTQVTTGFAVALFGRWGSLWYLRTAAPWFWSLFEFQPEISSVASLPGWVQFHMIFGWAVILLFPFTRLVHIFTVPITYLWRPYQVVIWNRAPSRRQLLAATQTQTAGSDPPGDDPPQEDDRRHFLSLFGIVFGAFGVLLVAVPSAWFLIGGLRKPPRVWRSVGNVDSFKIGTTVKVAFLDPSPLPWAGVTARTAAWLRRESADRFIAFSVDCTHLGCPVRWLPEADLFMCPCHGGVYYGSGKVASGPPPRPLVTYPVRIRNGAVEILTSPLPITS